MDSDGSQLGHSVRADARYLDALTSVRGEAKRKPLRRLPVHAMLYQDRLLQDVPIEGVAALEVGGGSGEVTFRLFLNGAREVVCLEPESAGSSANSSHSFAQWQNIIGTTNQVTLMAQRLEDYTHESSYFDLIVMNNVINHLDERACANLRYDASAWDVYRNLAARIYDLAAPAATLLVADCSSRNISTLFGGRNPVAPSIDWAIHQPPTVWVRLFQEAGFVKDRVRWDTLPQLGGRLYALLNNRLGAYLTTSHFILRFRK